MNKQRMWAKAEVEVLTTLFNEIPLSTKNKKSELIRQGLINRGFEERTLSSILRKTYSLGLVNYNVEEKEVKTKCYNCDKPISVKQRYYDKYDEENLRCDECRKFKKYEWRNSEKGKKYHYDYFKQWKLDKKELLSISSEK